MNNTAITPISTTVAIKMNPNTSYTVTWSNTYTGQITSTRNLTADGSGNINLSVNYLSDDVAVKIK